MDIVSTAADALSGLGVLNMTDEDARIDAAQAVIVALGLDDFDAAVERGARRLLWEQYQGCVSWDDTDDTATTGNDAHRGYALDHVRAVLEAALTGAHQ